MNHAERLYEKMMLEADRADEAKYAKQTEEIVRRNVKKPETKAVQYRKQIGQLRSRTLQLENELKLQREVEVEAERQTRATMALSEANLTAAERKARDAETLRFQRLLGKHVSAEYSPEWREEANLYFNRKR